MKKNESSPQNVPVQKCSQHRTWWRWCPSSAEIPSAWRRLPAACRHQGLSYLISGSWIPAGKQRHISPSRTESGARLIPKRHPLWTHLFIACIFNTGALPFDGGVWSPQESQRLLCLMPLSLWQQEARRLRHEAHQYHQQCGRDGAADGQPAPVHEETCRRRFHQSELLTHSKCCS